MPDWVMELESEEELEEGGGAGLAGRGGCCGATCGGGGGWMDWGGPRMVAYAFVDVRRSLSSFVRSGVALAVAVVRGDRGAPTIVSRVTTGARAAGESVFRGVSMLDRWRLSAFDIPPDEEDELLGELAWWRSRAPELELRRSGGLEAETIVFVLEVGELFGDLLSGMRGEGGVVVAGVGGEMPCILETAYQSVGAIQSYSWGLGGRQQPGEPGFLQAASPIKSLGLRLAHLQKPQPLKNESSALRK